MDEAAVHCGKRLHLHLCCVKWLTAQHAGCATWVGIKTWITEKNSEIKKYWKSDYKNICRCIKIHMCVCIIFDLKKLYFWGFNYFLTVPFSGWKNCTTYIIKDFKKTKIGCTGLNLFSCFSNTHSVKKHTRSKSIHIPPLVFGKQTVQVTSQPVTPFGSHQQTSGSSGWIFEHFCWHNL